MKLSEKNVHRADLSTSLHTASSLGTHCVNSLTPLEESSTPKYISALPTATVRSVETI